MYLYFEFSKERQPIYLIVFVLYTSTLLYGCVGFFFMKLSAWVLYTIYFHILPAFTQGWISTKKKTISCTYIQNVRKFFIIFPSFSSHVLYIRMWKTLLFLCVCVCIFSFFFWYTKNDFPELNYYTLFIFWMFFFCIFWLEKSIRVIYAHDIIILLGKWCHQVCFYVCVGKKKNLVNGFIAYTNKIHTHTHIKCWDGKIVYMFFLFFLCICL